MPIIARPPSSRPRSSRSSGPATGPAGRRLGDRRVPRHLLLALLSALYAAGCGEGDKLDLTGNPPAPDVPVPAKVRGKSTSQPLDISPTP
ncbi:MAG: hypothetical protein BGO49_19705 [Planctomycetales bacterium 71-10]|nr:MAG: hypothetical protein BGO49_19705 [Planctomycetales bacterium 71-10]